MPSTNAPNWADLVQPGGYLTPSQRQAFEQAIRLVSTRLHQVLARQDAPRHGQFDFDAFVDSLEADFLQPQPGEPSAELSSDAGQTAFWMTRLLADRLLALHALNARQ